MAEIGVELFQKVFQSSDDARDLWAQLRDRLHDTRVEIVTSVEEAAAIPWELLRDPKTDTPLALRAAVFVRAHPEPAQRPQVPRPSQGRSASCWSSAARAAATTCPSARWPAGSIKGLSEEAQAFYQLDVLRPPTFEQLARVLRQAKAERQALPRRPLRRPRHVRRGGRSGESAGLLRRLAPCCFCPARGPGRHGYLLFENPAPTGTRSWSTARALGKLLVETDVPVLVLNACRSAHAEAPTEPEQAQADVPQARPARPGPRLRLAGPGGDGRGRGGRGGDALQRLRRHRRAVRGRPLRQR